MKQVAVTGADGVLGRAVMAACAGVAVDAVAVVRSGDAPGRRAADLANPDDVASALDGVDVVIHTASSPLGDPGLEVRYLENVIAAARVARAHVVYVSIVNVDRNRRVYPYYAAKYEAEMLLARSGVPYTIQRAAQFHPFIAYIFGIAAKQPVAVLPPKAAFQPLDVDAFAGRLAQIAVGQPLGMARDVVGPHISSARELFSLWTAATGRHKLLVEAPLPIALFRAFADRRLINESAEPLGPTFESWLAANAGSVNPYERARSARTTTQ